jgi:CRP-like cAMP-binding protein
LKSIDLPLRKELEHRHRPVEQVYFPESGFASVVANGSDRSIEVGLIGRDGMTGLSIVMGADRPPNDTFVQMAGAAQRLNADALRKVIEQSPSLHRSLLRYCHAFLSQASQTAVANGRHKIEERLARWLLMAHDRSDGDDLPLTHEFLAIMLCVRRPGVTVALEQLEQHALIRTGRGMISIIDRQGLEEHSNGAYSQPDNGIG